MSARKGEHRINWAPLIDHFIELYNKEVTYAVIAEQLGVSEATVSLKARELQENGTIEKRDHNGIFRTKHDWAALDAAICAASALKKTPQDMHRELNIPKATINMRLAILRRSGKIATPRTMQQIKSPAEMQRAAYGQEPLRAFHPLAAEILGWRPGDYASRF